MKRVLVRFMEGAATSMWRSVRVGIGLTFVSYLNGGVRYPGDDNIFPPIWVQLLLYFLIYFACFFVIDRLFYPLERRRKKNRIEKMIERGVEVYLYNRKENKPH